MGDNLDRFNNAYELLEQAKRNSPIAAEMIDAKGAALSEVAARSSLSIDLSMDDWGVVSASLIMLARGEKPNEQGREALDATLERFLTEVREKGNAVFRAAKEAGDL